VVEAGIDRVVQVVVFGRKLQFLIHGQEVSDTQFDPAAFKLEQQKAWDDSAAGWNKWWSTFERAAQRVSDCLLEMAWVQPGQRVLDLATGSGEPAVTAARVVGSGGKVVGVDQSSAMLQLARERAQRLGLKNIDFVQSDVERLALDEANFDAVLCRWGLMFMPDLVGTLKRLCHLLKPGGWLAAAVWASPERVPMISLANRIIKQLARSPEAPADSPGPFRLADTAFLERVLRDSGFRNIAFKALNLTFEFESPQAFAVFRSEVGGTRAMLAKLAPETQRQIHDAIIAAARNYAGPDGVVRLENETICVAAQC